MSYELPKFPCETGPRLSLRSFSISRNGGNERRLYFAWLLAGTLLVCFANRAEASGLNTAMTQYRADQWGVEQGFPGGPVHAITQTADGYLWIGAENGLVRFDGVNFRLFNHA